MSDMLEYAEEDEAERVTTEPWRILVVDDEPDVHTVTQYALRDVLIDARPLHLLHAYTIAEAHARLADEQGVAMVLLDVVMEQEHAGLDLVDYIRTILHDSLIRIILRTGHPGQCVERDVYLRYDINGYHIKSEMSADKLFAIVVGALRSYQQLIEMQWERSQRRQAEQASFEKTRYVANMSHEMRTPFAAIMGYTDLLIEDLTEHGLTDLLSIAKKIDIAVKSQLNLVNNVLHISKIEAGVIDVHVRRAPVLKLFQEVAIMLQPLAQPRDVKLVFDCRPNALEMDADIDKIRQCLINMGFNAIKFSPGGTVVFRAYAAQCDAREWIDFDVIDDGAGIAPSQLALLFEPYQQGDQTHCCQAAGTGLGLVICRHLCAAMGGEVHVHSTLGKGSQFHIRLPKTLVC